MKLRNYLMTVVALLSAFSPEVLGTNETKTLIKDVKVKAINGGFNRAFAGVQIRGNVLQGSNACQAKKYKVKLISRRDGENIHVIGVKKLRQNYRRGLICPMVYKPVFKTASIQVRYNQNKVKDIIARDCEEYGNDVSIFSLLNQGPLPYEPEVEKLLGLTYGDKGITFQVYSSGCTKKESFKTKVYESYPVQIELLRVIPDRCRAYFKYGKRITFSWKELGLRVNEKFFITNPFSFQR